MRMTIPCEIFMSVGSTVLGLIFCEGVRYGIWRSDLDMVCITPAAAIARATAEAMK